MEHGERIEGGDARESGEGAEEERGAGSDEIEAVAGSKREREAVCHRRHQEDIKKKRSPRKRSKGALSRQQRRDAEGPG
jgi:hypothetical protein